MLLYRQVGHAMWAGLVVMVLSIPINGAISSRYGVNYVKKLVQVDKRLGYVNDLLHAIHVVKVYAYVCRQAGAAQLLLCHGNHVVRHACTGGRTRSCSA